jgi:beta-glucosidase
MSNEQPKRGETINVSVDVQNTGSRAGDVVVQLYIHQRSGSASRPVRQLKGFTRLNLKPNEKRTATFTLTKNSLSFWSPQIKQWVEEPATFDVWVGEDSIATLHGLFKVIETMAINPVVGHSTLP